MLEVRASNQVDIQMKTDSNNRMRLVVAMLATSVCSFAQATGQQGAMPPGGKPPAEMPRPGSVNYVQGGVSSAGEPLTIQSVGHFALTPGQAIDTGNDGYVEVLLTPGAFLRVGPNSKFNFSAVGLADTRITMAHGNALIEIDQLISGTHEEVTFGPTSVDMLKKGLYGFAADPAVIRVFDGKAEVIGQAGHDDAGKHDQIALADNPALKRNTFDENQAKMDPLFVWSSARSRAESEQNKLVSQNADGYYPSGDGWFWDPYTNFYGFWGPGTFYSPFGFAFFGGYYPGFYHGFYGGFREGGRGGERAVVGVHGNGIRGGFHGGGFQGGGGSHGGGGGGRR